MKEYAYFHDEGTVPTELRTVPFLNAFSDEQLEDVLNSSNLIQAEPGDVIIKEGAIDSRFYILLSGKLDVRVSGRTVTSISRAGEVFGELALVNQDKRGASVVAATNAVCLAVDQKFLQDIRPRDEDPAFHASLYEFLARLIARKLDATSRRLAEVERQLLELQSQSSAPAPKAKPAAKRVASKVIKKAARKAAKPVTKKVAKPVGKKAATKSKAKAKPTKNSTLRRRR